MSDTASWERLERRVIGYWWINGLIGFAVIAGGAWLAWHFAHEKLHEHERTVRNVAIGLGAGLGGWLLLAPPIAYWRWRFAVQPRLIVVRHGILFHEEKVIPTNRLQHVDLTRGPIESLFGIATLIVFTAGTESASFRVPGLGVTRARELRDRILQARGDDVI